MFWFLMILVNLLLLLCMGKTSELSTIYDIRVVLETKVLAQIYFFIRRRERISLNTWDSDNNSFGIFVPILGGKRWYHSVTVITPASH